MWIGIDFDHTIVDIDKPLPGAKAALQQLKDMGHKILIHSCNGTDWIRKVLTDNEIPFDGIWGESPADKQKPVCHAYIDDRAIAFNGNWNDALRDLQEMDGRRAKIKTLGVI